MFNTIYISVKYGDKSFENPTWALVFPKKYHIDSQI